MNLAIILGGSKGLGKALCQQYQAKGWELLEFSRSGSEDYSHRCDMTQPEAFKHALKQELQTWNGRVERVHMIHNAARLGQIGPAQDLELHDTLQSIALNFSSLVAASQALSESFSDTSTPLMLAAISSGAAQKNYPGWSLYCATKAAMDRYMGVLAAEHAQGQTALQAVTINPGVMDTEMQGQIRDTSIEDFPNLPRFLKLKEDNALPSPASVADIIVNKILLKAPENGGYYPVSDYQ